MKTQEFLAKAGLEAKSETNAKKEKWGQAEAIGLLKDARSLSVAKGKKVMEVDLKKNDLAEAELMKLVLGPTGNLRAPTLKVGNRIVVGFNQEMYESVF